MAGLGHPVAGVTIAYHKEPAARILHVRHIENK